MLTRVKFSEEPGGRGDLEDLEGVSFLCSWVSSGLGVGLVGGLEEQGQGVVRRSPAAGSAFQVHGGTWPVFCLKHTKLCPGSKTPAPFTWASVAVLTLTGGEVTLWTGTQLTTRQPRLWGTAEPTL